jgi:hypothetical protein
LSTPTRDGVDARRKRRARGRAGRPYGMVVGVAGRVNSLAGTLVE